MLLSRFVTNLNRFSERRHTASGELGDTFVATDPNTHETVSLLFPRNLYSDAGQQQAFYELECLSTCAHPTLLRLIGFFWKDSPSCRLEIATEFHQNGTLEEVLKRERSGRTSVLNATQKSKVIFGVVAGMAFLHGHGIIHYELNPDHIFLNNEFEPVIRSFGKLPSYEEELDMEDRVIGIPWFTAPELFCDEENVRDFPVDVYSFAVILYSIFAEPREMDDGKPPPRNSQSLIVKVSKGVRFVRKVEIPDGLWEVIESCWKVNPKERPTFQELIDSFRGGQRYVIEGADRNAVLEYENRVYGQFGSPNRGKPSH
jgi:serine/threonine protein kinase